MLTPAVDEYHHRQARRRTHDALGLQDGRLAYGRLVIFGGGIALAVAVWRTGLTPWSLLVPVAAFLALAVRHDRVLTARRHAALAIGFYERGLARLEDRWPGTGERGDRFKDDEHLYANDLDLFGRGSLFELLSLARTRAGEETLAGWLKAPADPETIRGRHDAIRELTPALDLRESLALAGHDVRDAIDTRALTAWGAAATGAVAVQRIIAVILTAGVVALVAAWAFTGAIVPLLLAIAARALFVRREGARLEAALGAASTAARELEVLRPALARLERERFSASRLTELQSTLIGREHATRAIARLHRYVEMHDWEHNIVFTPIAALLMWSSHLYLAIEHWRAEHGHHVAEWLRIVGEFEALSSLSAYAYEHPGDPFPTVGQPGSTAFIDGIQLAHPLLPRATAVANDLTLGGGVQLVVVSGSNMSGKSTMLRTVGINVVLAQAGAPVRATSLRLSPLVIGATLRIQDSLQEGRSRFYAEISRIQQVAELSRGPVPLLFLLDEIFHGTNSHDRQIGASGVLRALVDRSAIGLITTHDLALTAITTALAPRAINVHFEDWFDGGEMRFDYRMKPGPVTRSNAIALMKAVGLEVDEETHG